MVIQERDKNVEKKVKEELEKGQSLNNKVESFLWVALQPHLVDELRVVVTNTVQGGVPKGAGQPRVPTQRGAAVRREQTEIGPEDGLHEGQHLQLQRRNQDESWSVRRQHSHH